jgi:hypothetical protein
MGPMMAGTASSKRLGALGAHNFSFFFQKDDEG